MVRTLRWALFAFALSISVSVAASVKDIRTERLPDVSAVRKAYDDVADIEAYVRLWSPEWRYPTPKNEVAVRLKTSLTSLKEALNTDPNNEELVLLIGLVAHYAYNVDVEGTFELAVNSFQRAHELSPKDHRADWFLAAHECESSHVKEGMEKFLTIEGANSWRGLSSGFWDDYINCGLIANMPAHVLRAGHYATELNAQPSKDRDLLLDLAGKRLKKADLNAAYGSRDVWTAENRGSQTVFTSTMFGISFTSRGTWKANLPDVDKGTGMVQFQTDPHPGKSGQVYPNILVIVRPPKPGESLVDFEQSILKGKPAGSIEGLVCPTQDCFSAEIVQPGGYKAEGDAHFIMAVFKRDSPEFPGLLFEAAGGPTLSGSDQPQYFHPPEKLHRLDGALYYLVGFDCASSVLTEARSDYDAFLKSIRVE